MTVNTQIIRHADLPFSVSTPSVRAFPTEQGYLTYSSVVTPSGVFGSYKQPFKAYSQSGEVIPLYAKEITIPQGAAGVYSFGLPNEIRTAYFSEGSNVRTIATPLFTISGTELTGEPFLNITYTLMSLK